MVKRNLPQPFGIDKIRFSDCFTTSSQRHFAALISGYIVVGGTQTITQVILTTRLHELEYFAKVYRSLGNV